MIVATTPQDKATCKTKYAQVGSMMTILVNV
jgi:hypothetical protein